MLQEVDLDLARETSTAVGNFSPAPPSKRARPDADSQAPLAYSDYVLQRQVGAGWMGKVYQARQRSLDRNVAVKFLRKSFLSDQQAVARFLAEARTIARFNHPRIVGIHGLGRTPIGGYFLVMDWLAGPDLQHRLESSPPIPIADALRWTRQACAAVEHAHQHQIVHCDLKPGNLVLTADEDVCVTDFGLARSLAKDAETDPPLEGTAAFMAPEQVSGYWGRIDPRTDVYGLGGVLFALLTGRPPRVGRNVPDILGEVASGATVQWPPDAPAEVPPPLRDACQRALEPRPPDRFPEVRSFDEVLARHQKL